MVRPVSERHTWLLCVECGTPAHTNAPYTLALYASVPPKARKRRRKKKSVQAEDESDGSTAILQEAVLPNMVIVDEALSDEDPSAVHMSAKKMEELDIFHGDTVSPPRPGAGPRQAAAAAAPCCSCCCCSC